MEKKRAYEIGILDEQVSTMTVRKLSEVEECLNGFMAGMNDDMDDYLDDVGQVYTVTIVTMTDKEMDELPEWYGT